MLNQALKDQVKAVFAGLKNKYTFQVTAAASHPSKADLVSLLEDVASCSEKINVQQTEGEGLSFKILKNGEANPITFRAGS